MKSRSLLFLVALFILWRPQAKAQSEELTDSDSSGIVTSIDIRYVGWGEESVFPITCNQVDEGRVILLKDERFFQRVHGELLKLKPASVASKADIRVRAVVAYLHDTDDVLCIGCDSTMFLNGKQVEYSMPLERLIRSAIPMSYYSDLDAVLKPAQ